MEMYDENTKTTYYYNLTPDNTLEVFENNCLMATISNVKKRNALNMFLEIVFEMRGVELDYNGGKK